MLPIKRRSTEHLKTRLVKPNSTCVLFPRFLGFPILLDPPLTDLIASLLRSEGVEGDDAGCQEVGVRLLCRVGVGGRGDQTTRLVPTDGSQEGYLLLIPEPSCFRYTSPCILATFCCNLKFCCQYFANVANNNMFNSRDGRLFIVPDYTGHFRVRVLHVVNTGRVRIHA